MVDIMKTLPKVSFVLPVFNTEEFLEECIESIIADHSIEKEIIVVNDASPGNCDAIMQSYPNVKYIKFNQNRSQFQARLVGLQHATGKYVCFVDSDDYFVTPEFGKLCEEIEHHNADFIIFDCKTGNPEAPIVFTDNEKNLRGEQIFDALCNSEMRWNLCDKLFRTQQLKKLVSYWDVQNAYMNMCDDYCLFACLAYEARLSIRSKSTTTYFYRVNQNSETRQTKITVSKILKHLASYKFARDISLGYLENAGAPQTVIQRLDRLHFWNMTWYFDTYIRGKSIEDKSKVYLSFLESFNRHLAVDYLLRVDYSDFCSYVNECKSSFNSPKKVRSIGIIVSSLGGGGTERVAVNLGNMFQEEGYKVTFITASKHTHEYKTNGGIRRYVVKAINGERFVKIDEICQLEDIDTILCVDYYIEQTFSDLVWARLNKLNVISMEHNMFFVPIYVNSQFYFNKRLLAYKVADALTCLSPMDLFAWKSSGVNNVFYVPNQVTFNSEKLKIQSTNETKKLVFVGRLCEAKGLHFLSDLMSVVKQDIPDIQLDVVGSFSTIEDEQRFKNSIKQNKLEKTIRLVGQVTDVEKYFADASAHLMLSRFEGYPMVLLEAKAHGVPSVIFDMPYLTGSSEKDGCIQVPYGNVEAMASKIVSLLSNKEVWQQYSRKAIDSLSLSSRAVVLAKWLEIFKTIENSNNQEKSEDVTLEDASKLFMHEFYKTVNNLSYYQNSSNPPVVHSLFVDRVIALANVLLPIHSKRRKIVRYLLQKCLTKIG